MSTTTITIMVNVWITETQYAAILKHTDKPPATFVRELIQEEMEQNGWDNK